MPVSRPVCAFYRNATKGQRCSPFLCCRLVFRSVHVFSKCNPSVLGGNFVAATLIAVLICCTTAAIAGSASGPLTLQIAAPAAQPAKTMTVSDASGSGESNYPLQFGRPFLAGTIPSGQCPVVSAGPSTGSGQATGLPTQADVKNRYPDGSVEFAVMAVVLPSIPAGGSVQLSFAPGACSNAPLTTAQMLDAGYNFDAALTLTAPPTPAKLVSANAGGETIAQWQAITNGGFSITLDGTSVNVTGINMASLAADWSNFNALIQAKLPTGLTFVSANGISTLTTTATGAAATLSFATPPTDGRTDLATLLDLTQAAGASLTTTGGAGAVGQADARTMLTNGDYKVWTSGPVAQTIILADDTPSRKYDIGLGDGYHPFRPRFEATFWPATHQVYVRAIGENGLSTELEDLTYSLTITGGEASPVAEETLANLTHPAMATWTKSFWLGGTPNPEVNIDNNLAYLESTRFVPNYDPSLSLSQATIANDYAGWWTNTGHDIGGAGAWTPGMPTTGARSDIGPEPSWDAAWLYSGDWRLRQTALGNADLAAWWPANVRETDTTERLNVGDPAPVAPAVGTGYGHPVAITDHTFLGPSAGGEGDYLYYNSGVSWSTNNLKVVGPLNANGPWTFDSAHEPAPFFIPYVLTGDPFYLEEIEMWAAYDAAVNQGLGGAQLSSQGRGPTATEGGAYNQTRGSGWLLRSRAEAAFAEPDGDPEKTYLTTLTQSDLARWDGALHVADPSLGSSAEYVWANQTGNPLAANTPTVPQPLGNWADGSNPGFDGGGQWLSTLSDLGYEETWMQWYVQYSIGRAAELGFAAGPLAAASGQYLTGMINDAGYPQLVGSYILPTSFQGSGAIPSWPALIADLSSAYLTGTGWPAYCGSDCTSQGPLPTFFNTQLYAQGYDAYVLAALSPLVDEGAPGAAQAEAWVKANIYQPLVSSGALAGDPSWAIVPRTDKNTLPAQPTALQ